MTIPPNAAEMTTVFTSMTNSEVISCFENDQLPGEFHHADHIRLAFAFLSEYQPLDALRGFSEALRRYAAARGQAQRYHETITYSYFFLIRERIARTAPASWNEFEARNPDLFQWKPGILDRYYRESTLQSELARAVFLFPDKLAEL